MALRYFDADNWFSTGNPTVTATWKTGDTVFVWGGTENNAFTLATPSATGLGSWSLLSSLVTPGECTAYLWQATATADGTSAVITSVKAGGTGRAGICALVSPGGATDVTAMTGSIAEAPWNTTVTAGQTVIVAFADFNATANGSAAATGSGTATKRRGGGDGATWGQWVADWQGVSAGTFDFGSADYTTPAVQVAQVAVKFTPGKVNGRYAVSAGDTAAQTQVASSTEYRAGSQLLVLGSAIRTGHSNGLGASWALPVDGATTNDPTWTQVGLSSINDGLGATFEVQTAAWLSSVLTADEAFTITIDAHSGGTSTFNYAMEVIELWEGPWSITQAVNGFSSTGSATATFSPAPTPGLEILSGWGLGTGNPATLTWAAPPAGFTAIPGAETPIVGEVEMNAAWSATNTTAGLTWSYTGGTPLATNVLALEFDLAGATLDQEGFRFYSDGTEPGSTPLAAQDANATVALGTRFQYRALLNATSDPAALGFVLRAQKNGSGGYTAVPVGATTTPTISWGEIPAEGESTGDPAAPYPGSITSLSELVLIAAGKPGTANGGTLTDPTGWTRRGDMSGATDGDTGGYGTALAADTGNMNLYVLTKDSVAGTESGTLTVDFGATNNAIGTILRLEKSHAGSTSWAVATGKDTSAGNVSVTTGTIDLAPGDVLVWVMSIPTDVTTPAQFSAHAISATGITFDTVTERLEIDSTQGNDQGGFVCSTTVLSGSGTVACTITATAGGTTTNVRGPLILLRARPPAAITNELFVDTSGSITAGGENTTARLTAPSGKTTSDFAAGRIADDENPLDAIDIPANDYTEVSHVLNTQSPAVNGDFWDLRYYAGSSPLDTYTVTGRITLAAAGATSLPPIRRDALRSSIVR